MPTTQELLDRFADILIETSADTDPPAGAKLLHLQATGDEAWNLGVKDLEGEHPGLALLGFEAPAEWLAMGVLSGGWAAPWDDGSDHEMARGRATRRPSSHPDAVRATTVLWVGRDRSVASRTVFADGRSIDDPPEGFVTDVLQRVMGVATAPPGVPVGELFTSLWLALVGAAGAAAVRERRRVLSWAQVVDRHPAISPNARRRDLRLAAGVAGATETVSWAELLRWARRGSLGPLVDPTLARWMDEGFLCRWLLGQLPPVAVALDDACSHLTDDARRNLREAVDLLLLRAAGDAA